MPSLPEEVQSPLLQTVFTRQRDTRPVLIDISRFTQENPDLPQIVVTPSTPRPEERPSEYPLGRLKVWPTFYEDDFNDEDLSPILHERAPIQPKWSTSIPLRVLRVTCVLGVVLGLIAVHFFLLQPEPPR